MIYQTIYWNRWRICSLDWFPTVTWILQSINPF